MRISRFGYFLLATFAIKTILLAIFSSDYQNLLFIPFVKHFVCNQGNPWDFFFHSASTVELPYHPLMLYILSFFYLPIHILGIKSVLIKNLLFKLPTLISDIVITLIMFKTFPNRNRSILAFYALSPIITYACYMHSQFDLIPTCFLFLSFYFLQNNKIILSALAIGLALNTKLHIIIALPFFLVYLLKQKSTKDLLFFTGVVALLYTVISFPYFFSEGFYHMAVAGSKQKSIFGSACPKIYS